MLRKIQNTNTGKEKVGKTVRYHRTAFHNSGCIANKHYHIRFRYGFFTKIAITNIYLLQFGLGSLTLSY